MKLLLSSIVGIATMVFITAIFLVVAVHQHRVDKLRTHALDTLQLANKLENEIATMETSDRAFLLTGDPKHIEPFHRHTAMIQSRIDQLLALVADDSSQRKRIKNVKNDVQTWLEKVAAPAIARAGAISRGGAPAVNANEAATSSLQNARDLLRQMQDSAQIVLNVQAKNDQWASVSYQVLVFAPKLDSVATRMETAEAKFLVSGDKADLEAYRHAAGEFVAFHGHLSVLCADDAAQSTVLAKIKEQIFQWQTLIAAPEIAARQENKNVASMIATGEGRRRMDEIRLAIGEFQRTESTIYERETFHITLQRLLKTIGIALLCLL
ncbi:MAG: CHASE3 domain-containing protein, partial [Verrucomicrobiota bacterium]|nr:CHASE3 domain-containing protein [Verrucomicrobiota bacterium]